MLVSAENLVRRVCGVKRPVAVGVLLVGVTFAGGVAIGSDGRDGSAPPGTPASTPAAPVDLDDGRGNVAPSAQTASVESREQVDDAGLKMNGRGGVDPATGPLRPAASSEVATNDLPLAVGEFDTDSGEAPIDRPAIDDAVGSASVSPEVPVDLDVPGVATGGPDGPDTPHNDSDG